MEQVTSKPTGAEVTPKPVVSTGEMFDQAYFDKRMAQVKAEGEAAPVDGEKPSEEVKPDGEVAVKPVEEDKSKQEPTGDLLEEIELKDGRKVPVMDLMEKAQFSIPVGEKEHVIGFNDLLKFAGLGINSSEKNRTAKEVVAQAQKAISEAEKNAEQNADAKANAKLDAIFKQIQAGIDPGSQKPFASEADRGAAEYVVKEAQKALNTKAEPITQKGLSKEDIEKLLDERENSRDMARRLQQNTVKAQDMLEKAVEPFTQKFLKADGKTISPRLMGNFKTDVLNECVRVGKLMGGSLNETQAKAVLDKAIKTVLPDYEEFSGGRKTTATVESRVPIPTLKPAGGGSTVPTSSKKSFSNQEDVWKSALKS